MTDTAALDAGIDEAMAAAAAAGQALRQVEERLGSAGSWSTYDTWFGGGAIGSYVKLDRLDQAQHAASRAEESLAAVQRSLLDRRNALGARADNLNRQRTELLSGT